MPIFWWFALLASLTTLAAGAEDSLAATLFAAEDAARDRESADESPSANRQENNFSAPDFQDDSTLAAAVDEVAGARAATSETQITDILQVMERLFAGGNYLATRQITEALLDDNPAFQSLPPLDFSALSPETAGQYAAFRARRQMQREQARFFHARSLMEMALLAGRQRRAKNLLAQAAEEFARLGDNFWQFAEPQYRAASYHFAGRCYDYLTDFSRAIFYFRRTQQSEPSIELSIDTSLQLARALQEQAEIVGEQGLIRSPQDLPLTVGDQKRRADLLKEAEQELTKITSLFSPDMQSNEVELMLIELRYRLGAYGDVEYQANDFLKRASPGSDDYARASYLLANAVYQQGDLARVANLFTEALAQKISDPKLRGELAFGQGRVNMRLAETASVEMRQTYLARAETAFRQAVQTLPFGAAWENAVREFAKVLLDLREYREADSVLRELLDQPQTAQQIAVYYYAGLAARGLGDYQRAEKYLQTVVEFCAARGRELRLALQAIMALAELQASQQLTAEALAYYRAGEYAAEYLREFDLYAAAHLGAALALAELTDYDPEKRIASGGRLGDSLLDLLASANAAAPTAIQTAARTVGFRAHAFYEWNRASAENLTLALDSLQQLRGRLLPRLREDELEYVKGKIIFWQARLQRKQLIVNAQIREPDYQPVFDLYRQAADIIEQSIVVNPRGIFAAAAHFLLGEIFSEAAELHREIARHWREHGRHGEALAFESDSQQEQLRAVEKLRVAIATAENDTALRVAARTLLGNTYLQLADKDHARYYDDGLRELRILLNEPSITPAQRVATIRGIAAALVGGEQYDEALRLLQSQSVGDLPSALQAMKLQLSLGQPRAAYRTLHAGVASADADAPQLVEAKFELAVLALNRAPQIAADNAETVAMQNAAIDTLADLASRYAGSAWASLSLLSLGNYLIEQQEYARALAYAETALQSGSRANVTTQALYLLQGRALLAWGKAQKDAEKLQRANEAFIRAERANIGDNPLGRRQRAFAILEQGNAAAAQNRDEDALRYYGRVFAIFYQEYEAADEARLQAALIQEKRGNYELAWKILDQGFEQTKLLTAKLRIRDKLDAEKRDR